MSQVAEAAPAASDGAAYDGLRLRGVTNLMSGFSNWSWMTSPDQASQARMFPAARSWV